MAAEERDSILASGQRLDRYELLTPIASGGMATVWLARLLGKRGFEKLVAIKTIRTEFSDDPRFEEMFLDEARIASGIQHPNVAQITDLGEERGVLYIVMEWVDGESLAKLRKAALKRGIPVPLGVALRVLADACAGLHAAHELRDAKGENLGIVHRDISPHNILVSSTGVVKVIDFGIAKAKNRMAKETGTGVVKGKVAYMAREQAMGVDVDRRVDIWAIGVCLYELIAGELPFDGDNQLEIFQNVISLNKRPYIEGATPAVIDDILDKALARIPEERYKTAAAMERALEEAIQALGVDGSAEAVASFVQENLADRFAKRQELVHRALESAARRVLPNSVSEIDLHTDDFRVISSISGPPSFEEAPTVAAGKLIPDDDSNKVTTEIPVAERTAAPMPLNRVTDEQVARARQSLAPPERKPYLEYLLIAAAGVIAFLMWKQQQAQRFEPAAPAPAPSESVAPIESTSASASVSASVMPPPSASLSAAPSASAAPSVSASVQPQHPAAWQKPPPPPPTAKPEPTPVASTPPPAPSVTAPPPPDDPEDPYQ
jgi:eukaryotic-like serine/threonine-protein kinase